MNLLKKISRRLKELRATHGLTQEEFASMAGFSYKFYQQIEAGRKKQIWLETVQRLASAYGLEVWEFLSPDLKTKTRLPGIVMESKIHYRQGKKKRAVSVAKERKAGPTL